MLGLFVVLSVLALLAALSGLEFHLRERRLARAGRFDLQHLVDLTGLGRHELMARVGPPDRDGLVRTTPEQLAALPRRRPPLDPDHPAGNLAAAGVLALGLALAAHGGSPAWWALAAGGGYLLVCLAWAGVAIWREGRLAAEDRPAGEDALDAEAAELERLVDEADVLSGCQHALAVTRRLEAHLAREEAAALANPLMPLLVRLIATAFLRVQRWRVARCGRLVRREQERTAALADELERDMLEAHVDALAAETHGELRHAARHRAREAVCRDLLRGLDGRGAPGDEADG